MTSRCQTKNSGLAVGLLLAALTPMSAQVRQPVPATGISQLSSVQQLAAAQIAQLPGGPSRTSPAGPASSKRPPLATSPRITSTPAAPGDIGGVLQIPGVTGGSVPWNVIVMLTALTLIPSILVCMTPFARLLIVFHFLRQALGLQTTPSNQTLIGLSLILTFFLMQPVANQIYQDAFVPMQANQITAIDALARAEDPMRHFMAHYVRDKDVSLFVELAHEPHPASINDVSMRVLLPAYILSELKAGFQIGTVLFLPFLIVDMVVASITTSVGMLQLPPVVISTPLKLLLFLMVDGWHLLVGSLMRSFQ
jgi:flagellar biosynthetic protein FliP